MFPMDRRVRKRIIIAVIFFLIGGGLIWGGLVIFRPSPSCFDGKQNQGEEGIDCAGPCPSCELKVLRSPQVLEVAFFAVSEDQAVAAAKVRNPNLRWAAARLPARWELSDASGERVGVSEEAMWLRAGETKEVVAFFQRSEGGLPFRQDLKPSLTFASSISWVAAAQTPDVPLLIRERLLTRSRDGARVEGIMRNDSLFDLDRVLVRAALLQTGPGIIIAAGSSELRTVRSGEERFFSVVLPMFKADALPGELRLSVDTNVFEDRNFLRR